MHNYSESEKQVIQDNLIELLRIDSFLHDPEGIRAAIDYVKNMLKELDLSWEEIQKPGFGDLAIARSKQKDKTKPVIMLSGHIDTIFKNDSQIIELQGDKLFGHATQDMKGGIIAIVEILKNLDKQGQLNNIIFALSGAEEQGPNNPYKKELAELGREADYVLIYESTMDFNPNSEANERSIVRSRKGLIYVDITITGPGGHSGVLGEKHLRKSTNLLAAELMLQLESRISNYELGTTVNTGMVKGGIGFAVLSAETKLDIDIRYRDLNDKARFLDEFNKIIEELSLDKAFEIKVDLKDVFPPMQASQQTDEFIDKIQTMCKANQIKLHIEDRGGGSEGNLIRAGAPDTVIIDGLGVKGDNQHTPNEYLYIDSIFTCIKFSLQLINLINSPTL